MAENADKAKSLFEQEALRLRALNKGLRKDEDDLPFWTKVFAICLGIAVAAFAFVFFVLPLTLYYTFAYAFVASKLWAWFVVPTFGVGYLGLIPIIGIMMLIRVCTFQIHVNTNKDERSKAEKIAHTVGLIIAPWFILLMGYIFHLYM